MAGACYPRRARLTRRGEFDRAFQSGQRFHTHSFRVHLVEAPEDTARLGITLSRKVARRAHQRNRIKRMIRESFRHRRADLPPFDLVLLAKPDLMRVDATQLREELARLWQRVCTLKPGDSDGTIRAGRAAPAAPIP